MSTISSTLTSATDEDSWSIVSDRMGHDVILQAFDAARRAVSVARTGHVGMFPGYDHLELAAPCDVADGVVVITARVIAQDDTRHTVEYEACALQTGSQPDRRLLARAVGCTLERQSPRPHPPVSVLSLQRQDRA